MIVYLKIYSAGKVFDKIYVKAIRDILFSNIYVACDQRRDRVTQFFGRGDIQQKGKI